MPEIKVTIGGRPFVLVCDPGEEPSLQTAAGMLDNEARSLEDAIGRVPESRMLLMAGLMLADRTKQVELEIQTASERTKGLEDRLRAAEAKAAGLAVELNNLAQAKPEPVNEADLFGDSAALAQLKNTATKLEKLADHLEA